MVVERCDHLWAAQCIEGAIPQCGKCGVYQADIQAVTDAIVAAMRSEIARENEDSGSSIVFYDQKFSS